MLHFRIVRGLLVLGVIAGFGHGFRTLHRRHEHRRYAEMEAMCQARREPRPPAPAPAPPPAPPPAPAPR